MFFLFFLFPVAEIYTYFKFIAAYSFIDAILYTLTSAALGMMLMSLTGKAVVADMQKNLSQQKLPTDRIMHRAVLLLGGLLIFLPGILSDILGALCLLPGSRHLVVAYAKIKFAGAFAKGSIRFFKTGAGAGMGGMGAGAAQWPPPIREERDATIVDVTPISVSHTAKKSD
jgi:UPF0716 family protein affecting phage T7 exclusion